MSGAAKRPRTAPEPNKENRTMPKRLTALAALLAAAALLLALPAASASAASPWWQVITGSHPTNLWKPSNTVQEVQAGPEGATLLQLEGETVVCMYNEFACTVFIGLPNTETAQQLQEALEAPAAYGPGNVKVTGDPVASRRFLVESIGEDANKAVPPLTTAGEGSSAKVLSGGSGRLVLTLTNLGNAAVDGTSVPVKITDELPEGVVASGAEGYAGVAGAETELGPVDCSVESQSLVSCTFEGTLPPYEAIEVEIPASLTGDPPVAGAPGKVTVSGGNAKAVTATQAIKVSPEPTPFGIDYFSPRPKKRAAARRSRPAVTPSS